MICSICHSTSSRGMFIVDIYCVRSVHDPCAKAFPNCQHFLLCAFVILQRYEERDLDLKPLPAPKLVQTPEGIPNELFGSIVMVTEFISSFSSLFMFADNQPLCTGMYHCCHMVGFFLFAPFALTVIHILANVGLLSKVV